MSARRNYSRFSGGSKAFRNISGGLRDVAKTASTALSVATTIAGLINVEFKYWDVTSNLSPSTTGAVIHLNAIAQGDGVSNRDGVEVKNKSLELKWSAEQHASATTTIVRFLVVIDVDPNATTPSIGQIIDGTNILSFRNLDYRKKFVILKDWTIHLGDKTTMSGQWYKKLNMQSIWSSTAGNTIQSNGLYLVHLSNEATNYPTLDVRTRIRYLDN